MDKKPRILIADASPRCLGVYEKKLQIEGFEVILSPPNLNDVKAKILRHYPHVVVLEYAVGCENAVDVINFSRKNMIEPPEFIVLGDEDEKIARAVLLKYGTGNYMKKPSSICRVCNTAVAICANKNFKVGLFSEAQKKVRIEKLISRIYKDFEMPLNRNGSSYLAHCIYLCCANPKLLIGVTKILYPKVAKYYNIPSSALESCMRKSLESLWKIGRKEKLKKCFCDPQTDDLRKKKASSLEFISTIVNVISLHISIENEILQYDEIIQD